LQIQSDGYSIEECLTSENPKPVKTDENIKTIMAKQQNSSDKFKFFTERSLRQEKFEMTRFQSASLRKILPKKIYWIQIVQGGLIQWNWCLLNSYLLNGSDCPEHQELVEEYIATLPKAA
jgi:hypothetical protein